MMRLGAPSLLNRHTGLQLFGPVEHDVNMRRGRPVLTLNHQEATTVWGSVEIRPQRNAAFVRRIKQLSRFARRERRRRLDVDGHHRVARAVEQLPAVSRPDWLVTALD